ncbi:MAG TPA: hypothetical protein VG893_15880 [Terracidiphilus sp.]|nr:hypothetical protein [Terracidiphilus sp.]
MRKILAVTALAFPFALAGCGGPTHVAVYGPPPPGYNAVEQHGFRDGLQAGLHDYRDGQRPDPMRHGKFRNPPLQGPAAGDYQQGFREGYDRAYQGPEHRY